MGCCASDAAADAVGCQCCGASFARSAARLPEPLKLIALRFEAVVTHSNAELDVAAACSFSPVLVTATSAAAASPQDGQKATDLEAIVRFLGLLWSMASGKSLEAGPRWLAALDACVWMAVRPGSGCPPQAVEALLCSPKGVAALMLRSAKKNKAGAGMLREVLSGWAMENEAFAKQPLVQKAALEPVHSGTGDGGLDEEELGTNLDLIRVTVGESVWWNPESSEAVATLRALVRISAVQGSLSCVIADIGSTLSVGNPRTSFVREVVIAVLWSFGSELLCKIGTAAVAALQKFNKLHGTDSEMQKVTEEQAVALLEATIQVLADWLGDSSDSGPAAIISEAATTVATFDTALASPRRARGEAATRQSSASGVSVTGGMHTDDDSSSGEESAALARISLHGSPQGRGGSSSGDVCPEEGDALPEPPRGFVIVEEALLLGLKCKASRKMDMPWVAAAEGPRLTALRRSVAPGGAARSTVVEFLLHQLSWGSKRRSGGLSPGRPYSSEHGEAKHASPEKLDESLDDSKTTVSQTPAAELDTDQRLADIFNQLDRNGDGSVNKRELIKACANSKDIADLFRLPQRIRQEDGSREEFERIFQGIDANDDREIDWAEFKAAFAAHTESAEFAGAASAASMDVNIGPAPSAQPQASEKSSEASADEAPSQEVICLLLPKRQLQMDLRALHSKGLVARAPAETEGAPPEAAPLLGGQVAESMLELQALEGEEEEEEQEEAEHRMQKPEEAADLAEGSSADASDAVLPRQGERERLALLLSPVSPADQAETPGDLSQDMEVAHADAHLQDWMPSELAAAQSVPQSWAGAAGYEGQAATPLIDHWDKGEDAEGNDDRVSALALPFSGHDANSSQDFVWNEPVSEEGTLTASQSAIQAHAEPSATNLRRPHSTQEAENEEVLDPVPLLNAQTHFQSESVCVSTVLHVPGEPSVAGSSSNVLQANALSPVDPPPSLHEQASGAGACAVMNMLAMSSEGELPSAAELLQQALGPHMAESTADAAAGAGASVFSVGEVRSHENVASTSHATNVPPMSQIYSVGEVPFGESASQARTLSPGELRTMDMTSKYSIGEVPYSEASLLNSKSFAASALEADVTCQAFETVPEESEAAVGSEQEVAVNKPAGQVTSEVHIQASQPADRVSSESRTEVDDEPKSGAGPLPPPQSTAELLQDDMLLNGFPLAHGVPEWAPEGLDPDFIAGGQDTFAAFHEPYLAARTPPSPMNLQVVEEIAALRNQVEHLRAMVNEAPCPQGTPSAYGFNAPVQHGVPPLPFGHPVAALPFHNGSPPYFALHPGVLQAGGPSQGGGQLTGHGGAAADLGPILQAVQAQLSALQQQQQLQQQLQLVAAVSPSVTAAAAQLHAAQLRNFGGSPASYAAAMPPTPPPASSSERSPAATLPAEAPAAHRAPAIAEGQAGSLETRLGDIAGELEAKLRDLTGELVECKRQLQLQQASTTMLTNELRANTRQQRTPRGNGLVESMPHLNVASPRDTGVCSAQPGISGAAHTIAAADAAAGLSAGADMLCKAPLLAMDPLHVNQVWPSPSAAPTVALALSTDPRAALPPVGSWAMDYDPVMQRTPRGLHVEAQGNLHHLSSVAALQSARARQSSMERPLPRDQKYAMGEAAQVGKRKATRADCSTDVPLPSVWQLQPHSKKLDQDLRNIDHRLQGLDGMFKSMLN